jgi:hypothetical protein
VSPLQSLRSSFLRWLGGSPDDDVLRWLYRGLLAATVAVIILDYADLQKILAERTAALPSIDQPSSETPSAQPLPARRSSGSRATPLHAPDAKLRDAMAFDLVGDGRLMATGLIAPGTAKLFADELAKRGAYIKTVVLRSPGGSVTDALEMGRLIRDKKFKTEVENGRYCASSCPLVFAGGVERHAGSNAAIGVHQVAAVSVENLSVATGMEDAQKISAECQQYLRDMGIDLEVWIHAMETPRQELYYFQPTELLTLKLATAVDDGNFRGAKIDH